MCSIAPGGGAAYAAIVLRMAEGPPEGLGRFELTPADLARTGADVAPCECGKCECRGGACAPREQP